MCLMLNVGLFRKSFQHSDCSDHSTLRSASNRFGHLRHRPYQLGTDLGVGQRDGVGQQQLAGRPVLDEIHSRLARVRGRFAGRYLLVRVSC